MTTGVADLHALAGWGAAEAPVILAGAWATARRLLQAVALAAGLGGAVGGVMRGFPRLAEMLTPWLLAALALPWLPLVAGLSLAGYLTESRVLAVATLAAAPRVADALGTRYPLRTRAASLRGALRRILATVLLSEILGLNSGIGAQVRLHFLFWNPALLGTGVMTAAAVWGLCELVVALLTRLQAGQRSALG